MLVKLILVVAILASSVQGRNTEKEENKRRKKDRKPGKTISLEENGDIDITISRRKYSNEKERLLCCPLATKHCRAPCKDNSCSATCTVSCGFFGFFICAPLTCEAAHPNGCIATTTASGCDVGWTRLPGGTKCFKVEAGPSNWLAAQTSCLTLGGTLAKIESADEQALVFGLIGTGTTTPIWIGLQDFLLEGTFSWADGTALGAYTNWLTGQPDNNSGNQHCAVMTATGNNAGLWNDVICNGPRGFVCEKPSV
eukprot:TRINITY_DN17292_c0_g1_i1.p1 TRINITY_DN17292_c0_g1~~TRINITY_DN17292_c0_g1_i1.p1  ORF type:complete len:254 (-),score=47.19 TRINITY_DN17292_c0_g1_i1:6-767(-)